MARRDNPRRPRARSTCMNRGRNACRDLTEIIPTPTRDTRSHSLLCGGRRPGAKSQAAPETGSNVVLAHYLAGWCLAGPPHLRMPISFWPRHRLPFWCPEYVRAQDGRIARWGEGRSFRPRRRHQLVRGSASRTSQLSREAAMDARIPRCFSLLAPSRNAKKWMALVLLMTQLAPPRNSCGNLRHERALGDD